MKLIVESGSSKTDWRILDKQNEIAQIQTIGFNPYHHTSEEMLKALTKTALQNTKNHISEIYFYGAGCGTSATIKSMQNTLQSFFEKAQVEVNDDLLAVARGLCQKKAGIVAILGTGANAGFYDGKNLQTQDISLGYVLGDEGSGAYFGKVLVQKYLLRKIPENLHQKFVAKFGSLSRSKILENVYQKPFASRYLGSFAPFLFENIKENFCQKIVSEGFQSLIQNYITLIPEYKEYPLYFVGSVAVAFEDILQKVFQENNLKINKIAKNPIEGLVEYHKM